MENFSRPGLQRLSRFAREIVAAVGTPVYCYDLPTIEASCKTLLSAADQVSPSCGERFYLAFFALPNLALFARILGLDRRLGIICNTPEEIEALKDFGWQEWDRVVFSGGVLPEKDLRSVAMTGCLLNVASRGNLEILTKNPSLHPRIGLRLDLSESALKGIRGRDIAACMQFAARQGTEVTGFHAYPGTNVQDMDTLVLHAENLIRHAFRWNSIEEINFGGGFWYDYGHASGDIAAMFDYARYFREIRGLLGSPTSRRPIRVAWEPGRVIFAAGGFFVTSVLETRCVNPHEADIYLDASFVQMPAPKLKQRQHKVIAMDANGSRKTLGGYIARLCGPTTLSDDKLFRDPVSLPMVAPGDLLAVCDAGAYGRAGSYTFLGKAQPPEVMIDHDGWRVIRSRQETTHLLKGIEHINERIQDTKDLPGR